MPIKFSSQQVFLENEKDDITILSSETTDFKWGKIPQQRSIEELLNYGIINIDKPARPTSHEVVSYIKKILDIPKAGHSGTLDPQVTGVLPVALKKATRILNTLLLSGKEYVCNMRLHRDVEEEKIQSIMKEYVGDIYQRPPVRASVKRVLRVRRIYEVKIIEIKEREVLFSIKCQAGTYIRKFCHDIGQSLSCGAHMKELRRITTGPFTEEKFLTTLQDLYDALEWYKEERDEIPLRNIILPMEYGVKHLPKIFVKDTSVDTLCHGAPLALPGVSKFTNNFQKGDLIAIFSLKHELIALGEAQIDSNKLEDKEQGLIASVKKVLMERNTYPNQKKEN
ncbi:MAG: RNA-guided pseudouridylation complex pseudouridine synthase subunit Cbf5 [Candidatus Heimdallarchaeota archaeon]|nr:RNA-guided pseudouridylation complex pseudouridine synthase subunit Cbf5 [Candidatus Heimdallarchaeota archaeon]MCK4876729.1 RNA-guided pseudouridylation complex pseudouridine synthase subunit Cbf5 [Candidatus Heimdallarchaeota archaeon]